MAHAVKIAAIPDPILAVLEAARRFVKVRETQGPNRGLEVDFFNRWTFGPDAMQPFPQGGQGAPWCASFVNTIGRLGIGAAWPFPPEDPAMSNTDKLVEFAKARTCFYPEGNPRRGDIFVLRHWRKADDWIHTGFVSDSVGADEHFETIEGNTNDDGSRDGNGVYIRRRQVSQYTHFIRWTELLK